MTTPRALNSRQEEVLWGWFTRARTASCSTSVIPIRGDATFEAQGHRMIAAVLEQLG